MLVPTDAELGELAAQVRFDLESAGSAPVPADRHDEEDGGVLVYIDQHQVHVAWSTHDRLDEAATDMKDADRETEDVVRRYETTRATMHLALGSILNAFGYHTRPQAMGFGHVVVPIPG
ncbi:hypothetical protein ACFV3R_10870 [Streptomyces sp. NPDC059740]|uniref:hypothetical protein n=1 Tax=Streptomyces sp. NPDC059740 TaxID=3346926 RepID=UPI0036474F68